jgi:hypothetical protein
MVNKIADVWRMKRRYRTIPPFGWLLLGLILAIFCALLVVRTTPIDAPGAAPASVNRPA